MFHPKKCGIFRGETEKDWTEKESAGQKSELLRNQKALSKYFGNSNWCWCTLVGEASLSHRSSYRTSLVTIAESFSAEFFPAESFSVSSIFQPSKFQKLPTDFSCTPLHNWTQNLSVHTAMILKLILSNCSGFSTKPPKQFFLNEHPSLTVRSNPSFWPTVGNKIFTGRKKRGKTRVFQLDTRYRLRQDHADISRCMTLTPYHNDSTASLSLLETATGALSQCLPSSRSAATHAPTFCSCC